MTRFRTRLHQRQYRQLGVYFSQFASNIFHVQVLSVRGHKYGLLFCNKLGYVRSYPIKSKVDPHVTLNRLFHEVEIPTLNITDNAPELTSGNWLRLCQRYYVRRKQTKPKSPWQNPVKRSGGIVQHIIAKLMKDTSIPLRLWDYCWTYCSELQSLVASGYP